MARKRVKKPKIMVNCPKCGKQGIIGVDKIRTRGKLYIYLVVRHYERGRVRRCFVKRLEV